MENMEEIKKDCECNNDECNHTDCNCGDDCNCEHGNSDPMIIEMEDINGEKVKVQIVGTFDDNDKSYAIVNDLDNDENSYIFEVQTTDEGDMLVSIDDQDEFDRLCKVVENLVSENK